MLLTGRAEALHPAWSLPLGFGSAQMELDPLSAVFALAIALVTMAAAVYGGEYLQSHAGRKNLGVSWFFFNLLLASMLLVVTAHNGLLFLMSWEAMSLASFFLVMFEGEKPGVRKAGWTYLVTMHLGTALLLAMFALLSRKSGSLDFDALSAPGLHTLRANQFGAEVGGPIRRSKTFYFTGYEGQRRAEGCRYRLWPEPPDGDPQAGGEDCEIRPARTGASVHCESVPGRPGGGAAEAG